MAEFYGLYAKSVLVMRGEEVRIEELIDKDGHFGPIDVVCQFPDIPDFSNHVLERFEVYLIMT